MERGRSRRAGIPGDLARRRACKRSNQNGARSAGRDRSRDEAEKSPNWEWSFQRPEELQNGGGKIGLARRQHPSRGKRVYKERCTKRKGGSEVYPILS